MTMLYSNPCYNVACYKDMPCIYSEDEYIISTEKIALSMTSTTQ